MNKPNKVNYSNYVKPNDKFWKDNFMKVLLCWYFEDCTWNIDKWHSYNISESDKKKIEREFFRLLEKNK